MKDLQDIIDNAPEGATHICAGGEYYDLKNFACWNGHFWADDYDLVELRSLADIKQILELQEQNEWIKVDNPEQIHIVGTEILCYDGCDYHIDYVEVCPDYGYHYMANGTEVEAYKELNPPK